MVGQQPDCLTEIGDGAVAVALHAVSDAATVEGVGKSRIKPDRRIVISNSAVKFALGPVNVTANLEGAVTRRIDPQHCFGIGKRKFGVAEREISNGTAAIAARGTRLQPDHLAIISDGTF